MKVHRAFWRVLCWTAVIVLLNAALTTCFGIEPKIENETEPADTTAAKAAVDSIPLPIFKQDSLTTTSVMDSAAAIPTELTFGDSTSADTLYVRKKKQEQPIYKKWWFLAIVGGVVAASLVAISSGDDGREDLPEFPDPPER